MEQFEKVHKTYQKINTLYKRGDNGKIIIGDFSCPEFGYLFNNEWLAFEKIDGSNVSWYWDGHELQIHGKTSKASIRKDFIEKMKELIPTEKLLEIFPPKFDEEGNEVPFLVKIYGELYGKDVQTNGKKYILNDINVKIFDINIDGWWLQWDDVKDICNNINMETVPEFGVMTLAEAEKLVIKGFKSTTSEDKNLDAEGLVLRPIVQLYNRKGERVIVKVKTCDYRKLNIK